jgi:uroporphyrinogen-III decarboxylase
VLVGRAGPARPLVEPGESDLADRLSAEFPGLYPMCHVSSPLWCLYDLWGFDGMMAMMGERPDLVRYAAQRYLELSVQDVRQAQALGAAGIWVEECLTDMISPAMFADLNVPVLSALCSAIRSAGMHSIYYYCGNPNDRLDLLLSVGADALALEESKKHFTIDIAAIAERVQGRCTLLGNLDAMHLLEHGSEADLRLEIARQIAAGRRNGSRFIMSIGSPVTPDTPVERVRLYCNLVRELGGI